MNNELMRLRDPTALLVLRVWMEHGAKLPLRAYIRETNDVSRGFERTSNVTDVEAAVQIVRTWLETLIVEDAARTNEAGSPPGATGATDAIDATDGPHAAHDSPNGSARPIPEA